MTPSTRRRKISKWVENVRRDRRRTLCSDTRGVVEYVQCIAANFLL